MEEMKRKDKENQKQTKILTKKVGHSRFSLKNEPNFGLTTKINIPVPDIFMMHNFEGGIRKEFPDAKIEKTCCVV